MVRVDIIHDGTCYMAGGVKIVDSGEIMSTGLDLIKCALLSQIIQLDKRYPKDKDIKSIIGELIEEIAKDFRADSYFTSNIKWHLEDQHEQLERERLEKKRKYPCENEVTSAGVRKSKRQSKTSCAKPKV